MNLIDQVAGAMQNILTTVSDTLAKTTGFMKRQRKLTGAKFVQTLVFGWLSNPKATYEELAQTAATVGITVTPQALEKRFTQEAAECLKQVLEAGVEQVISADPQVIPILQRFSAVSVQDSTTITLPQALATIWTGSGRCTDGRKPAGLKVQLRWDLLTGALTNIHMQEGRVHDRKAEFSPDELPKHSIRLADLGYFSLDELQSLSENQIYWLTRIQAMCAVFDDNGNRKELAKWLASQNTTQVEFPVLLGVKAQLPCRLLALRVSDDEASKRRRQIRKEAKRRGQNPSKNRLQLASWTILGTNTPEKLLNLSEAMVLARVRWQIELLFKLWKSHGQIDEWRSEKPWRILTEVYAKLLAMVIQHWILLTGCWHVPNRSLHKAAKTIARYALHIAVAFAKGGRERLVEAISTVCRCLAAGCRLNKRRKEPATYQLLLALD
jgi:hypothetical protein